MLEWLPGAPAKVPELKKAAAKKKMGQTEHLARRHRGAPQQRRCHKRRRNRSRGDKAIKAGTHQKGAPAPLAAVYNRRYNAAHPVQLISS